MFVTLVLAAAWIALTGEVTLANVLVGLVLGHVLARLTVRRPLSTGVLRRVPQFLALLVYFAYELGVASARVTVRVLSPRPNLRPAILAVPIELEHDWQITLLADLVTLTPGTLSVDVAADRRRLYVHFLDLVDPERERRAIREGFEERIRRLAP